MGFRFLKGSHFPLLKGHIVKSSVDSASEYAKRIFFKHGCMIEEPYVPGSDESASDDSGESEPENAKRAVEEVDGAAEDDEGDEPPAKSAKFEFRTKCGRVAGDYWDGCAQCTCGVCVGYFDIEESEQSHSQEGESLEA